MSESFLKLLWSIIIWFILLVLLGLFVSLPFFVARFVQKKLLKKIIHNKAIPTIAFILILAVGYVFEFILFNNYILKRSSSGKLRYNTDVAIYMSFDITAPQYSTFDELKDKNRKERVLEFAKRYVHDIITKQGFLCAQHTYEEKRKYKVKKIFDIVGVNKNIYLISIDANVIRGEKWPRLLSLYIEEKEGNFEVKEIWDLQSHARGWSGASFEEYLASPISIRRHRLELTRPKVKRAFSERNPEQSEG